MIFFRRQEKRQETSSRTKKIEHREKNIGRTTKRQESGTQKLETNLCFRHLTSNIKFQIPKPKFQCPVISIQISGALYLKT